ncbi:MULTISPECIES: hypothetical protein [Streptomyces]|uniref:Uncharacterized protein n=1 Tax=Streptomyces flaveolus TaxID=67297 RepID=A0ABV3AMP6_9ACTN|nr:MULTISPECIES: hypothetical protein [Streptomyces]
MRAGTVGTAAQLVLVHHGAGLDWCLHAVGSVSRRAARSPHRQEPSTAAAPNA